MNKYLQAALSTTCVAKYTIAESIKPIEEMPQLDINVMEMYMKSYTLII
jgi:hypothetical protein